LRRATPSPDDGPAGWVAYAPSQTAASTQQAAEQLCVGQRGAAILLAQPAEVEAMQHRVLGGEGAPVCGQLDATGRRSLECRDPAHDQHAQPGDAGGGGGQLVERVGVLRLRLHPGELQRLGPQVCDGILGGRQATRRNARLEAYARVEPQLLGREDAVVEAGQVAAHLGDHFDLRVGQPAEGDHPAHRLGVLQLLGDQWGEAGGGLVPRA